jgi:hypothetical protein
MVSFVNPPNERRAYHAVYTHPTFISEKGLPQNCRARYDRDFHRGFTLPPLLRASKDATPTVNENAQKRADQPVTNDILYMMLFIFWLLVSPDTSVQNIALFSSAPRQRCDGVHTQNVAYTRRNHDHDIPHNFFLFCD